MDICPKLSSPHGEPSSRCYEGSSSSPVRTSSSSTAPSRTSSSHPTVPCARSSYASLAALALYARLNVLLLQVSLPCCPRYMFKFIRHPLADCTGASQTGLRILSRRMPGLPADLREHYSPKMNGATFDFPCPGAAFDDLLRSLGVPAVERKGAIFVYYADPTCENLSVALARRENNGRAFSPHVVSMAYDMWCSGLDGQRMGH